ncbi:MAG: phospho-N-acetylmuramoyl-pentapeptide-transferase [Oscillospiraceae bacterium]|nr:phospho-N-acetylmuramoyl-pentapeptide-transferase [Oscillospiraceae bacterium]
MVYWLNLLAAAIAFALAAAIGKVLIPMMHRLHFGATIYEKGPKWQEKKNGTPLMGGFMFIIAAPLSIAICYAVWQGMVRDVTLAPDRTGLYKLIAGVMFAILNAVIGFIDDFIKGVKHQNLGLRAKQKMVMQLCLTAAFMYVLFMLGDTSTAISFPFIGELELGILYYPLMILYLIFLTNAVNLTDGVDGLCGTVTVVFCVSYLMIFSSMGLHEYSLFASALAGGCMGFLVWNLNPAKIFMGDTGSMFLGGAVCAMGFITHEHLLLALVGIIYVCEALSVVLQVISFKTTGKRIFKMSPIHHHFEMCGFSEYKIVIVFSTVGLICGIIANVIYNVYLK